VHPGVEGDRGPSALDWAIQEREREWGVTVLQAVEAFDAGPVWESVAFPMREASKASLYRNEVTEAAVRGVLAALARIEAGERAPAARAERHRRGGWDGHGGHGGRDACDGPDGAVRGRARPPMRQADRRMDWQRDDSAAVLARIRAADGVPGVRDALLGVECYLHDAWPEDVLRGAPGEVIAKRDGAICRATVDGAVWITHLRPVGRGEGAIKLPAVEVLGDRARHVPEVAVGADDDARRTFREIRWRQRGAVGYLHFDFLNGAMGTEQCERLLAAFRDACRSDARVIVLMGGSDFWSNGIHLNRIEAAASPADESWRNIAAMNDLAHAIITAGDALTVAALRGNAGAGGVFLALAADEVVARRGAVLNPHYRNMGNLYGSEYWTYLLPRRVGDDAARALMGRRLPLDAEAARAAGLLDGVLDGDVAAFDRAIAARAEALAVDPGLAARLADKRARRARDEAVKPLARYREEELDRMRLNFYGFDPSYHVARYAFVHKRARSWTPLHLARHRRRVARREEVPA